MAESFSREKLRQAPQKEGGWKNPVLPSSCVTPAGTSIEVQNEWEENTHRHTSYYLVHGDLPRQRSFGTILRFTGPVPADSRQ